MRRVQVWAERTGPLDHEMADALEEADVGGKRLVHGMSVTEECIRMVLETSADPERYAAALGRTDTVRSYEVVPAGDDRAFAFVEQDPDPRKARLQEFADAMGLVVVPPIEFHDDDIRFVLAGEAAAIGRAFEAVPDGLEATVERVGEYAGRSADGTERTDRQREAVAAAVDLGYYDVPRTAGVRDVAERLECAPSTATELLRRAEAGVMAAAVDTDPGDR